MERLRQRADFLAVASGARANRPAFTLQSRPREDAGEARLGLTVTRKTGTATERNRIRRRLRALAAAAETALPPACDYVLVGRRAALHRPFAVMLDELRAAARPRAPRPHPPSPSDRRDPA